METRKISNEYFCRPISLQACIDVVKYRCRQVFFKVIILLFILSSGSLYAQDPQYSQYYASPLLIAPSFAGNSLGSRAFISFRDQWPTVKGAFLTYSVALDNNFYDLNSGLGIVAIRDVAGSARLGTTSLKALYSYRFNVDNEWRIRPGISFSFNQRNIDFNSSRFADMISITGVDNNTIEQPTPPYNYFDAASSVVVYNSTMWFGVCVDHLMRPNQSFTGLNSRIPMTMLQFGGVNFAVNNNVGQSPEIITLHYLLKYSNLYRQFDIGVNWYHAPLLLGFAWRGIPHELNTIDCLIFTVGMGFNNIAFGYSYDFTISKLGPVSGGAHEITISIGFNEGGKSQKRGAIPCPDVVKYKMFGNKESFR